jgi:hypothetical protein
MHLHVAEAFIKIGAQVFSAATFSEALIFFEN